MIFFSVRQDSNDNIKINCNQRAIATTSATGTNDVPGYDKSRTATNTSKAVSDTTTDAEPASKLEE